MDRLTVKAACETAGHEALVREAYLDSSNVWTWGIGVTDKSGHRVGRYKDAPAEIEHCLEVYVWLLRTVYLPPVLRAFAGHELTENELAAALAFQYNTGAIQHTSWVDLFMAGELSAARRFLTSHYLNGGALEGRRKAEAALFFDGVWSHPDGAINVYPVLKPSYHPDFRHPERVDIREPMAQALAA
jgi:lysozyme